MLFFLAKHYPFYGVEWHPEKNEHEIHPEVCHSENAIFCSSFLASFFRDECSRHQSYQLNENYIDFKQSVKMFDTRDVVKMKELYVFDV